MAYSGGVAACGVVVAGEEVVMVADNGSGQGRGGGRGGLQWRGCGGDIALEVWEKKEKKNKKKKNIYIYIYHD